MEWVQDLPYFSYWCVAGKHRSACMDRHMTYNMTFLEAGLFIFSHLWWRKGKWVYWELNRETFCALGMLQLNNPTNIQYILLFKCTCEIYEQICLFPEKSIYNLGVGNFSLTGSEYSGCKAYLSSCCSWQNCSGQTCTRKCRLLWIHNNHIFVRSIG